jgi:hypothetical protein
MEVSSEDAGVAAAAMEGGSAAGKLMVTIERLTS